MSAERGRIAADWKFQALFSGSLMFVVSQFFHVWDGDPITGDTLIRGAVVGTVGGLLFGLSMRSLGARRAR